MKWFKDLTITEKTSIWMARLRTPDISDKDFADSKWITVHALKSIEELIKFNKNEALSIRMNNLMKKDMMALEKIWEINDMFIDWVKAKRTILAKDVDVLDKIGNTIMKRAVLVEKMTQEKQEWAPVNITLSI